MSSDGSTQTNLDTVRINDLCRELEVKAKAVIDLLPLFGITEKKKHSSSIPAHVAARIRETYSIYQKEVDKADEKPTGLKSGDSVKLGLLRAPERFLLKLPRRFTFYRGFLEFDYIFDHFNWTLKNVPVLVDLTTCESSNYQALVRLIQYAWFLTMNGCRVTFKYGVANSGPTKMLNRMGAMDWQQVLTTDGKHFGNRPGQMLALRRRSDVQNAINTARRAVQDYKVGFPDYLSYIVSELLYNSTEHGGKHAIIERCQVVVPSIF